MPAFSQRSSDRLVGLHPDLVRVLKRAIVNYDFMVIEGVRSDEQCYINFGKGRTKAQCIAGGCPPKYAQPDAQKVTWLGHALSSNHRKKDDGYGHAVDLAPYPLDWNDESRFRSLSKAILAAAADEGVDIEWGGNWKKSPDTPHYELVTK